VKRKEEFSRDMTREMGKVLAETRGDVQEAIDMTYYMAGEGRRLFGQTTPSELPNKFAMSLRQSIGVCGLITPWNFPMAIPSWKMMPALVCGNTLVIKPAEDTPLSTYHLVEILREAGLPPGVVNLVGGDGPGAGAALTKHADVPVVSFTGSTSTGRIIA
jgi:aldehyde dehydrogenase (NAD+)